MTLVERRCIMLVLADEIVLNRRHCFASDCACCTCKGTEWTGRERGRELWVHIYLSNHMQLPRHPCRASSITVVEITPKAQFVRDQEAPTNS